METSTQTTKPMTSDTDHDQPLPAVPAGLPVGAVNLDLAVIHQTPKAFLVSRMRQGIGQDIWIPRSQSGAAHNIHRIVKRGEKILPVWNFRLAPWFYNKICGQL